MNMEFLNKRHNDLMMERQRMEITMHHLDGHIQEVRNMIHELSKPAQESKDGQANNEETQQPPIEGVCDASGAEVSNQ